MDDDGRNRKIRVYLNRSRTTKIPREAPTAVWSEFYRHWFPAEITARQLAIEVWRGSSFAHLHNGRKNKKHWAEAWYVALDFDTEDERSSLDYLSNHDMIDCLASFAYTTPSHTPEAPRARVVFVFDEPITDLEEYEEFYRAMLHHFPWADQSTKDVTRFFYGSPGCEVWDNWSIMPNPVRAQILDVYLESLPKREPRPEPMRIDPGDVPEKFLRVAADRLLDNVRRAPDGEKHFTLNRIAYVFGGYVASGYYEEQEVERWLRGAVGDMQNVRNEQTAYQTIRDGLSAGKGAPLSFEVKQEQRPGAVI